MLAPATLSAQLRETFPRKRGPAPSRGTLTGTMTEWCWIRADIPPPGIPPTCGNCPPVRDHPDLRGTDQIQRMVIARQLLK
jgi:hypothetical protein